MKTDIELKEQALRALCLTRDYVGSETLPAIEGWEWYDSGLALSESMPESEWSRQFFLRVDEKNNKKLNHKQAKSECSYCDNFHKGGMVCLQCGTYPPEG